MNAARAPVLDVGEEAMSIIPFADRFIGLVDAQVTSS